MHEPDAPLAKPAKTYYRRKLPHIQQSRRPLFVTFATQGRRILSETARSAVLRHCLVDHGTKLWMHACVVMPDHVHLLFTAMRDQEGQDYGLSEILRGMKGASARLVNRHLGTSGRIWQSESYDHVLRAREGLRKTAEYICQNPVRAGLVAHEDDYPWIWREWVEGEG